MLRGACQCSISAAYVTAPQLTCDPKETRDVIIRARLSRTTDTDIANLITILRDWVSSGRATVVVGHLTYDVDATCQVVVQSFSDPICPASVVTSETPTATTQNVMATPDNISIPNIVGPIVGAIAVGVVLILVVVIAIQIFNHYRKTKTYEIE